MGLLRICLRLGSRLASDWRSPRLLLAISNIQSEGSQILINFSSHILSLAAKIGRGTAALEVAREDRLNDGAENDLGAGSLRERHPEDKDKFEGVVKGKPVDGGYSRFEDGQEGEDDPVLLTLACELPENQCRVGGSIAIA